MTKERFTWEYSNYDSTGEIHDWSRNKCLITDYHQKYEIEEWCQELNKIVDENEELKKENEQLKQQLFETSKELLWATSDEVDRALHYEDEVEELRKEIFE